MSREDTWKSGTFTFFYIGHMIKNDNIKKKRRAIVWSDEYKDKSRENIVGVFKKIE